MAEVKLTIREGQIWREVDPRFSRFVRVQEIGRDGSIGIRTVAYVDGRWTDMPRSRLSFADAQRFNGKRGNYELHVDAAALTQPEAPDHG